MAVSNKYTITRSNYTIKKKHQSSVDSTIYERDYMITTGVNGWGTDVVPYTGSNNFKILSQTPNTAIYRRGHSGWLASPNNEDGYWDADSVSGITNEELSENTIQLKPNSTSLLDYAYFGNCSELIRLSIDDIISKFPAQITVDSTPAMYEVVDKDGNEDLEYVGGSASYHTIDNPYEIDIYKSYMSIPEEGEGINTNFRGDDAITVKLRQMRYFFLSYSNYEVVKSNGSSVGIKSVSFSYAKKSDGTIDKTNGALGVTLTITDTNNSKYEIRGYYVDCKLTYVTKASILAIRPNTELMDIFYSSLDDFESLLLNRYSSPIYTVTFETPSERSTGTIFYPKKYTWNTVGGWNLDISSHFFKEYYNSLLSIAEFYDQYYSDNLWRMMSHDAIKNMDLTFSRPQDDEDSDDFKIGTTKFRELLYVYGRQLDDMRRYIYNIKHTTNITYNEEGNLPDYFLTDALELSGWDTQSLSSFFNNEAIEVSYPGKVGEYDGNDTNNLFLRTLKINSKPIFSEKGTRDGIESVLGLYGLISKDYARDVYNMQAKEYSGATTEVAWNGISSTLYDYTLNEYVRVFESMGSKPVYTGETDEDDLTLDEAKKYFTDAEIYNSYRTWIDKNRNDYSRFTLEGLPVAIITYVVKVNGKNVEYKYLIPWFDNLVEMEGNPYFQMYGGWNKLSELSISEDTANYVDERLTKGNYLSSITSGTYYDETLRYIKMVNNIGELQNIPYADLEKCSYVYVYDITDYKTYYKVDLPDSASHYFYLYNLDYNSLYGETDDKKGWINIPIEAFKSTTYENNAGLNVLHLESIAETMLGNNPHVGYGKYDDGAEYWKYFAQLFHYAIDNQDENTFEDIAYDCSTGNLLSSITNCGFGSGTKSLDNMKCWYFVDSKTNSGTQNIGTISGSTFTNQTAAKFAVGSKNSSKRLDSALSPNPFEPKITNSADTSASYSIMNDKTFEIVFNTAKAKKDIGASFSLNGFKSFINNAVLPYLKQVIPSTALLSIKYE